jgi:hypothetical protein
MNKRSCNEYFTAKEDIRLLPFVLGGLNLIFSFVSIYFAFTSYYIGLALSLPCVVFSALLLKKEKVSAVISLIVSLAALAVSLFVFTVNTFVF